MVPFRLFASFLLIEKYRNKQAASDSKKNGTMTSAYDSSPVQQSGPPSGCSAMVAAFRRKRRVRQRRGRGRLVGNGNNNNNNNNNKSENNNGDSNTATDSFKEAGTSAEVVAAVAAEGATGNQTTNDDDGNNGGTAGTSSSSSDDNDKSRRQEERYLGQELFEWHYNYEQAEEEARGEEEGVGADLEEEEESEPKDIAEETKQVKKEAACDDDKVSAGANKDIGSSNRKNTVQKKRSAASLKVGTGGSSEKRPKKKKKKKNGNVGAAASSSSSSSSSKKLSSAAAVRRGSSGTDGTKTKPRNGSLGGNNKNKKRSGLTAAAAAAAAKPETVPSFTTTTTTKPLFLTTRRALGIDTRFLLLCSDGTAAAHSSSSPPPPVPWTDDKVLLRRYQTDFVRTLIDRGAAPCLVCSTTTATSAVKAAALRTTSVDNNGDDKSTATTANEKPKKGKRRGIQQTKYVNMAVVDVQEMLLRIGDAKKGDGDEDEDDSPREIEPTPIAVPAIIETQVDDASGAAGATSTNDGDNRSNQNRFVQMPPHPALSADSSWKILADTVAMLVEKDEAVRSQSIGSEYRKGSSNSNSLATKPAAAVPLEITLLTTDVALFCDTDVDGHAAGAERFLDRVVPYFERSSGHKAAPKIRTYSSSSLTSPGIMDIHIVVAKTGKLAHPRLPDDDEDDEKQDNNIGADDPDSDTVDRGKDGEASPCQHQIEVGKCMRAIRSAFDAREASIFEEASSKSWLASGGDDTANPVSIKITQIDHSPMGYKYLSRQWIRSTPMGRRLRGRLSLDLPELLDGSQCTVSFDAGYHTLPYALNSRKCSGLAFDLDQLSKSCPLKVVKSVPFSSVDASLLYGVPFQLLPGLEADIDSTRQMEGLVKVFFRFLSDRQLVLLVSPSSNEGCGNDSKTGEDDSIQPLSAPKLFVLMVQEWPKTTATRDVDPASAMLFPYIGADQLLEETPFISTESALNAEMAEQYADYIERAIELVEVQAHNPLDAKTLHLEATFGGKSGGISSSTDDMTVPALEKARSGGAVEEYYVATSHGSMIDSDGDNDVKMSDADSSPPASSRKKKAKGITQGGSIWDTDEEDDDVPDPETWAEK